MSSLVSPPNQKAKGSGTMSEDEKKRVILVVLLFIVLIVAVLYYTYTFITQGNQNLQKKKVMARTSSPIPTGTGDENSPTSWSRYTYSHDFRISYPPYWHVVVDQSGNGVSFQTTGFHQDDDFSRPYGNSNEVVYTLFGQNDPSDMSLKDGDQFSSDTTSETMVVTHLKHMQIDGVEAVAFDYYPTDNVHFLRSRVAILKGNTMYRFTATYAEDSGKKLFEEMMQSLQFIQK